VSETGYELWSHQSLQLYPTYFACYTLQTTYDKVDGLRWTVISPWTSAWKPQNVTTWVWVKPVRSRTWPNIPCFCWLLSFDSCWCCNGSLLVYHITIYLYIYVILRIYIIYMQCIECIHMLSPTKHLFCWPHGWYIVHGWILRFAKWVPAKIRNMICSKYSK
jgi:hypothetical protein